MTQIPAMPTIPAMAGPGDIPPIQPIAPAAPAAPAATADTAAPASPPPPRPLPGDHFGAIEAQLAKAEAQPGAKLSDYDATGNAIAQKLNAKAGYQDLVQQLKTDRRFARIFQVAAESGLSLLSYMGSVIDKPFAAFRGLLGGDPKQLLLLLPFSESYLKGFWSGLFGIPVPEKHITGREVVKNWGLTKDVPGFHPLSEPADAVGDLLGLAIDLFAVPPVLPVVGGPTANAMRLLRSLEGDTAKIRQQVEPALHLAAILHTPDAAHKLGQSILAKGKVLEEDIRRFTPLQARVTDLSQAAIDRYMAQFRAQHAIATRHHPQPNVQPHKVLAAGLMEAGQDISPTTQEVVQLLADTNTHMLRTLTKSVKTGALSAGLPYGGLGPVSPLGKISQIGNERAIISLQPVGYWRKLLGDTAIEWVGNEHTKALLQWLTTQNPVSSMLLSLFHWTTGSIGNPIGSEVRQRAVDLSLQLAGVLSDFEMLGHQMLGLAFGKLDGIKQHFTLLGDPVAGASADRAARAIIELAPLIANTKRNVGVQVARAIFPDLPPSELPTAAHAVENILGAYETIFKSAFSAIQTELKQVGFTVADLSAQPGFGYLPRIVRDLPPGVQRLFLPRRKLAESMFPQLLVNRIASDPLITGTSTGTYAKNIHPLLLPSGALVMPGQPVQVGAVLGRFVTANMEGDRLKSITLWAGYGPTEIPSRNGALPAEFRLLPELPSHVPDSFPGFAASIAELTLANPEVQARYIKPVKDRIEAEMKSPHLTLDWLTPLGAIKRIPDTVLYASARYIQPLVLALDKTNSPLAAYLRLLDPISDYVAGGPDNMLIRKLYDASAIRAKQAANARQSLTQIDPSLQAIPATILEEIEERGIASVLGARRAQAYIRNGGMLARLIESRQQSGRPPRTLYEESLPLTLMSHIEGASETLALLHAVMGMIRKHLTYMDPNWDILNQLPQFKDRFSQVLRQTANRLDPTLAASNVAPRPADTPLVPVLELIKKLRINRRRLDHNIIMTSLARQVAPELWNLITSPDLSARELLPIRTALANTVAIPEAIAKQIIRVTRVRDSLNNSSELERILGSMANATRFLLTQPFPAFHIRNLTSGIVMNLMADRPFSTSEYITALKETLSAVFGRGPRKPLPYEDEMEMLGVVGGGVWKVVERHGPAEVPRESYFTSLRSALSVSRPHLLPAGLRTAGETLAELLPIARSGTASTIATAEGLLGRIINAGTATYEAVETVNRGSAYIALRRKGMDPAAAAEWVRRVQYDYTRLSELERRALQPVVLFYSWLRQNIGYMLPRVLLDWRSGPAQLTRAMRAIQQGTTEEMPTWLQESLAIPTPIGTTYQTPEGETLTAVVRQWGLPIEDLSLLVPWKPGRTLEKLVSRMHPLIGGAYRWITGREPYTGKAIQAGTGLTGIPNVDIFLSATPFSRIAATVATLAKLDLPGLILPKRLWTPQLWGIVDLLTGVKTGYYNLELDRLIEARDLFASYLAQHPYIRTGTFAFLPERLKEIAPAYVQQDLETWNLYNQAIQQILDQRKLMRAAAIGAQETDRATRRRRRAQRESDTMLISTMF